MFFSPCTLVLQKTFAYDSVHWTGRTIYRPYVGAQRLGRHAETKLRTYDTAPFKDICLIFMQGTSNNFILINLIRPQLSLHFAVNNDMNRHEKHPPPSFKVGRHYWTQAVFGNDLQLGCNREGFSVHIYNKWHRRSLARVRIGLLGNNENDCATCDSFLGVGGDSWGCRCGKERKGVAAGSGNCCSMKFIPTFVHVLVSGPGPAQQNG